MKPIVVYGDICQDIYTHCSHTRQSPENASVPIWSRLQSEIHLGMAYNVARNVAGLGEVEYCKIQSTIGKYTTKNRIFVDGVQVARIDNDINYTPPKKDILSWFENCANADYAILSDYGRGALADVQDIIQVCNKRGMKVIVDPKGTDWEKYRGAYCIKANQAEFIAWGDTDPWDNSPDPLADYIVITRGGEGVECIVNNQRVYLPATKINFVDECGAGDTFIAVLAVCLNRGRTFLEALTSANKAAGRCCEVYGTYAAKEDDL